MCRFLHYSRHTHPIRPVPGVARGLLPRFLLMRRLACLLVAMFAVVPTASASPFTWTVQGTIGYVDTMWQDSVGPYSNAFAIGQSFTLAITMEPEPAFVMAGSDPTCGYYSPVIATSFTSGSISRSLDFGHSGGEYIINAAGGTLGCDIPENTLRLRAPLATDLYATLHWFGVFATPAMVLDGTGTSAILNLAYSEPKGRGIASGGGKTSSVPEPSGLLALGLLALAWRRGRT